MKCEIFLYDADGSFRKKVIEDVNDFGFVVSRFPGDHPEAGMARDIRLIVNGITYTGWTGVKFYPKDGGDGE